MSNHGHISIRTREDKEKTQYSTSNDVDIIFISPDGTEYLIDGVTAMEMERVVPSSVIKFTMTIMPCHFNISTRLENTNLLHLIQRKYNEEQIKKAGLGRIN